MKKTIFLFWMCLAIFCSKSIDAQSAAKYKSQRDSLEFLYKFVLDKYDSVFVANIELSKKLEQRGLEITNLKNEIDSVLKKKNEYVAELTKAKEIITELTAAVDKLEAEVKRLSESKKTKQ